MSQVKEESSDEIFDKEKIYELKYIKLIIKIMPLFQGQKELNCYYLL